MSRYANKDKQIFTVILSENGIPITQISIDRDKTADLVDAPNAELLLKQIAKIKSAPKQVRDATVMQASKNYYYSLLQFTFI